MKMQRRRPRRCIYADCANQEVYGRDAGPTVII